MFIRWSIRNLRNCIRNSTGNSIILFQYHQQVDRDLWWTSLKIRIKIIKITHKNFTGYFFRKNVISWTSSPEFHQTLIKQLYHECPRNSIRKLITYLMRNYIRYSNKELLGFNKDSHQESYHKFQGFQLKWKSPQISNLQ